jgi:acetoacetyl-CoA synthetase
MNSSAPLWQPSDQQISAANITRLKNTIEDQFNVSLPDYPALHAWSVNNLEAFWSLVWDDCGVIASSSYDNVITNPEKMPGAQWFPGARLNYAENLLRKTGSEAAIVFRSEDAVRRQLSHDQLRAQVACCAGYLKSVGVEAGDRVVGFMPNMPETVVAMLATASLGAVCPHVHRTLACRVCSIVLDKLNPKWFLLLTVISITENFTSRVKRSVSL